MKKFIIASLLFFAPVTYSATTPDSEEFAKAMKLDCQTIGADSCTSRFIAVSACTFSYGIAKSEKTVKESIDIADDLFVLLMKGNGLNPNSMFDDQNLIKESIRSETIERVDKCKEWTKEAIPKIVLEKLANQQLKNLLMESRRHLGFGGLELLSRLNKVNEHVIVIHQIYF